MTWDLYADQSPFGLAFSALPAGWVIPFKMHWPRGETDRLWWRGAEEGDTCSLHFVTAFTQVLQGKCYTKAVKGQLFLEPLIHLHVIFTLPGMIYVFRRKGLSHSPVITSKSPSRGRQWLDLMILDMFPSHSDSAHYRAFLYLSGQILSHSWWIIKLYTYSINVPKNIRIFGVYTLLCF